MANSDNYSEQQKYFVEVFLEESRTNGNYSEVCKLARTAAGYSEETKISTIVESVKDLILEKVNLRLVQMSPKVLNGMEDVLDNPAMPGAKSVIAAAIALLDRAGVIKHEQIQVDIKTPNAVLILPAKQTITE